MINVNDCPGRSDNERIEYAIAHRGGDGIVILPPRNADAQDPRRYWLLERAVLLPSNITFLLQNCTVRLSDTCRDNFFRTANCGMGIASPAPTFDITLRGEGKCVLRGADHPRSTGDSTKTLHKPCPYSDEDLIRYADWLTDEERRTGKIGFWTKHDHTYGTDAEKENESQNGDWRNIGVLFANCRGFAVEGLTIEDAHGWAISLEACAEGTVSRIRFDAHMSKMIDGTRHNIENQDGLDLRRGCHDIMISDITGHTGDDVVALTAIAGKPHPGGAPKQTEVMPFDTDHGDTDIHDIIIRGVSAKTQLCYIVRLLAAGTHIYNVIIDGVIDGSAQPDHGATLLFGDGDGYGKELTDGIRRVTVSNVICGGSAGVCVNTPLNDCAFTNVLSPDGGKEVYALAKPGLLDGAHIG